jgi:enoyl-CoA hydratase/carnithine racemase
VPDQAAGQVLVNVSDGVATVTLNRPDRHNSLVPGLLLQLLDALSDCARDPGIAVVVLRAAGRSFSTGGDLRGFLEHADDIRDYSDQLVGLLNDAIVALFDCRVPVVIAIDGQVTRWLDRIAARDNRPQAREHRATSQSNGIGRAGTGMGAGHSVR